MRSDILRQLLKAHADGDEAGFRKAALQLADFESRAGHIKVADELRQVIAAMRPAEPRRSVGPVDIARPRGELADLLEGGYRDERLRDIVLEAETQSLLDRVLRENRERAELESWGVTASRRLLFYGPPGCGKTFAARVLAGELGLPLLTVRFDGLFSRFLGATAAHLKSIFDEMPRRPAVYLFDEFDAVGKFRGDWQDVGEIRRVVTSFLQLLDADRSRSIVIAATNFEEILDRAVVRRFDLALHFGLPDASRLMKLIELRLVSFELPRKVIRDAAENAVGRELSYADAARACDDAIKTMILDRRRSLRGHDLMEAFGRARSGNACVAR